MLFRSLLEVKLDRSKTHCTTSQIIETLQNMNVAECTNLFYQACYTGSDTLDALEQVFRLDLDKKFYDPAKLNKLQKN